MGGTRGTGWRGAALVVMLAGQAPANLRRRLTLLALVAGFVSVVAAVPPSSAAVPVPCVRIVEGSRSVIAPGPVGVGEMTTTAVGLVVPGSTSMVEDVDVSFAIVHDNAAQLRVRLAHDTSAIVQRRLAGSGGRCGR